MDIIFGSKVKRDTVLLFNRFVVKNINAFKPKNNIDIFIV